LKILKKTSEKMPFISILSDNLKDTIKKLHAKDKQLFLELQKKMNQIIDCDKDTIKHYKNIRYDLSDYKRVHIGKSFVLAFSVDVPHNTIVFEKLEHHDKAYKR
jgi:mRNA-degrading endonuclease RelE of RelBE toxin-antitoxin system